MADVRIGVTGSAGRMGITLLREVAATDGCVLSGASEYKDHPSVGLDPGQLAGIGTTGLVIKSDPREVFEASDVVLDFTLPSATVAHANLAAAFQTGLIVGTTALQEEQTAALADAAKTAAIVHAANMSVGVNLLLNLAKRVAAVLDEEYDIEIVEMHHRHKVDAPSGTALALGHAVAEGRGIDLESVARRGRDGITGARERGTVGFAALRGGDVVGDHSVVFAADGERLELTHKASSRQVFSRGAVRAARWVHGKPPGLYSMIDVLGLND
ncbi:MAG: 4-hydroxy-tetrahydrodipicolinate reductase [Proteobacteria bacterium]|nr:4-hydroxy-tetrahydrodipicolinate reductase [Pseudomonadota bacterium]